MNEVNIWQFMAYKIAYSVAKTANIELTFDMVKAVEADLIEINEKYFTKLYIGMIPAKEMKYVTEEVTKLILIKYQQPLNSTVDVILTKDDKNE